MDLVATYGNITLNTLTITGIIKRLKALQNLLHNLHVTARRLGKSVAARARVLAMITDALQTACNQTMTISANLHAFEDLIPP